MEHGTGTTQQSMISNTAADPSVLATKGLFTCLILDGFLDCLCAPDSEKKKEDILGYRNPLFIANLYLILHIYIYIFVCFVFLKLHS